MVSIQQENIITFINICALKLGAPKYVKWILTELKEEIHSHKITVEDFNSPFTSVNRLSRQKIKKETSVLNDMLALRDLTYIVHFIQKSTESTFFSEVQENGLGYLIF